jgi:hypothetical protein
MLDGIAQCRTVQAELQAFLRQMNEGKGRSPLEEALIGLFFVKVKAYAVKTFGKKFVHAILDF